MKYTQAVQEKDVDSLFAMSCSWLEELAKKPKDEFLLRYEFKRTFEYIHARYLKQREEGLIEFDDGGMALIKASALGKGVFYKIESVRFVSEAERELTMEIVFAYEKINYKDLPAKTKIYFMGYPVGKIYPLVVGERSFGGRRQLDSLKVKWRLRKCGEEACSGKWCILQVKPIPSSAVYREVFWHLDPGRNVRQ